MNARDVLAYGQGTLLDALHGLPEAEWRMPGACGAWSVADIVAHLASYELVLVDVIAGATTEVPTPHLDRFRAAGSAFNDEEVERRRGRASEATMAELAAAHDQTLELIAQVSPETLRQPGTLPWYGAAYALDDLLVYMAYGHKREHAAQIALVRDRPKG
jgi:uncharacterized protein (TIGR03083 family)